jgi:hypothetical protein
MENVDYSTYTSKAMLEFSKSFSKFDVIGNVLDDIFIAAKVGKLSVSFSFLTQEHINLLTELGYNVCEKITPDGYDTFFLVSWEES